MSDIFDDLNCVQPNLKISTDMPKQKPPSHAKHKGDILELKVHVNAQVLPALQLLQLEQAGKAGRENSARNVLVVEGANTRCVNPARFDSDVRRLASEDVKAPLGSGFARILAVGLSTFKIADGSESSSPLLRGISGGLSSRFQVCPINIACLKQALHALDSLLKIVEPSRNNDDDEIPGTISEVLASLLVKFFESLETVVKTTDIDRLKKIAHIVVCEVRGDDPVFDSPPIDFSEMDERSVRRHLNDYMAHFTKILIHPLDGAHLLTAFRFLVSNTFDENATPELVSVVESYFDGEVHKFHKKTWVTLRTYTPWNPPLRPNVAWTKVSLHELTLASTSSQANIDNAVPHGIQSLLIAVIESMERQPSMSYVFGEGSKFWQCFEYLFNYKEKNPDYEKIAREGNSNNKDKSVTPVDEFDLESVECDEMRNKFLELIAPFALPEDVKTKYLKLITKPEQFSEVYICAWTYARIRLIKSVILSKLSSSQKAMGQSIRFLSADVLLPHTGKLPEDLNDWMKLVSYGKGRLVTPFPFMHRDLSILVPDGNAQEKSKIWDHSFTAIFPILMWSGLTKGSSEDLLRLLRRYEFKEEQAGKASEEQLVHMLMCFTHCLGFLTEKAYKVMVVMYRLGSIRRATNRLRLLQPETVAGLLLIKCLCDIVDAFRAIGPNPLRIGPCVVSELLPDIVAFLAKDSTNKTMMKKLNTKCNSKKDKEIAYEKIKLRARESWKPISNILEEFCSMYCHHLTILLGQNAKNGKEVASKLYEFLNSIFPGKFTNVKAPLGNFRFTCDPRLLCPDKGTGCTEATNKSMFDLPRFPGHDFAMKGFYHSLPSSETEQYNQSVSSFKAALLEIFEIKLCKRIAKMPCEKSVVTFLSSNLCKSPLLALTVNLFSQPSLQQKSKKLVTKREKTQEIKRKMKRKH